MRPRVTIALLGALASVALVVALVDPFPAEADRRGGGVVVRAGDAVVSGADARIEGGPSANGARARAGDEESGLGQANGSDSQETEVNEENGESAPVAKGEVVLKMEGDEGVGFSGTCSVGGEEKEVEGQVPDEFTFKLDGDELECELRKEGRGALKMVLVSGNNRVAQKVNGDSTMKVTFSGNGVSSSTSSSSGSSSVVNQSSSVSSSSVVQSNSSSASR